MNYKGRVQNLAGVAITTRLVPAMLLSLECGGGRLPNLIGRITFKGMHQGLGCYVQHTSSLPDTVETVDPQDGRVEKKIEKVGSPNFNRMSAGPTFWTAKRSFP